MRNEIKTPGYSLVNLRTSYSWKQVRVDFGVENLFDKFYYLPTGGAYTGQGTTMTNPALPNYPQWGTAANLCPVLTFCKTWPRAPRRTSPRCPTWQLGGAHAQRGRAGQAHRGAQGGAVLA
jgi:hypothetical protein